MRGILLVCLETKVVSQEEPDGYYNRMSIERQAAGRAAADEAGQVVRVRVEK
jgi:hypothetical protein